MAIQNTPIRLSFNGMRWSTPGSINITLTDNGMWRLDGIKGKTLCLIEINIPSIQYNGTKLENIKLHFTPSDAFQDELLRRWLEAEDKNDHFVFNKPLLSQTRPSQLKAKIKRIQFMLNDALTGRLFTRIK